MELKSQGTCIEKFKFILYNKLEVIIIFYFYLNEALDELRISRNKLAVEAKVRPNTIIDLTNGDVSRIDLSTLKSILDTLNLIAIENGIDRKFNINDVIQYKYQKEPSQ